MATKKLTIDTDDLLEITLKPAVAGHTKVTVKKLNYSELQQVQAKNDGTPEGVAGANQYAYEQATGLSAIDLAVMPAEVIKAIDGFLA